MDASTPLDNDFSQNLELTGEIRSFLKETAKWAKLMAIVGFVGIGFMVLAGLMVGTFMGPLFDVMPQSDTSPFPVSGLTTFLSIFYILLALLYFFPVLYLYRFASKMQLALKRDDQGVLTESFSNLKSHYKFIGILLLIILGFYALMIVLGILATIFGMM